MKKYITILTVFMALIVTSLSANEPKYNTKKDSCYKSRRIMYPIEDVFNALKQVLMQSNLNIVTVTKKDGVLTAKGFTYNENEDTITSITVTIDFREIEPNVTLVKVIASYNTREKKDDIGQLGAAGVSLPIPVPLTGKYVLTGSGNIEDSLWYQGFFNSLDKILFENRMKYSN